MVFKIPIKTKKLPNKPSGTRKQNHEIVQLFGQPRILNKSVDAYLLKSSFDVRNFD